MPMSNLDGCYGKDLTVLEINTSCKGQNSQKGKVKMTQKTTDKIRELLSNANLNFESVENKALNDYLPKIFHNCPFTEDICTKKQCVDCSVFIKTCK